MIRARRRQQYCVERALPGWQPTIQLLPQRCCIDSTIDQERSSPLLLVVILSISTRSSSKKGKNVSLSVQMMDPLLVFSASMPCRFMKARSFTARKLAAGSPGLYCSLRTCRLILFLCAYAIIACHARLGSFSKISSALLYGYSSLKTCFSSGCQYELEEPGSHRYPVSAVGNSGLLHIISTLSQFGVSREIITWSTTSRRTLRFYFFFPFF